MPRPREFDKDEVLQKAMLQFWSRGYEATSVRDLTSVMGISSSSLYETFGDKHAVFMRALERYCVIEQARLLDIADTASGPADFVMRVFTSLDAVFNQQPPTQGSMAFNAMVEFGARDPDVTARLRLHYARITEIVTDVMARWQQYGVIPDTTPAVDLAHMLLTALIGVVTISTVEPAATPRDAVARLVLSVIQPAR
jgi:TetR/AcrR family transcriptional repressor of nem operon